MEPKLDPASVLRFGVFELDLRLGELRKGGVRVKVQDAPLRALRLFLSHPQQMLTRQEFRKALWADNVFVDFDRGINTTINRLRDTLGDVSANPIFIETVARLGYRWIAPVQVVSGGLEAIAQSDRGSPEATVVPPPSPGRAHSSERLFWAAASIGIVFAGLLFLVPWKRIHPRSAVAKNLASAQSANKTRDPQAQDLYLTGRYYWNQRTPEGLQRAADYFTQAIVHDPSYAQAYVGLADTYDLMREFASMPDEEAYPRAFAAASKAVELDDASPEAHATLGFVSFWWKRDAKAADREFQHALALNPAYVDAYHWYANILGCQGRTAESQQSMNRAQELDPASPAIRADKGEALLIIGQREQGIALLKQVAASDPSFASPHLYLSQYYLAELDGRNYLTEARAASQLRAREDDLLVQRAAENGFATWGTPGMLNNMLAVQKKLYVGGRLTAYDVARTEALIGDRAAALSYLGIALQRNESELALLRVDVALKSLHNLAEFSRLLSKAALPPFS